MKRTRTQLDLARLPSEAVRFLEGAPLYDSSCSPQARVVFADRDGGLYLKTAEAGTLQTEAAIAGAVMPLVPGLAMTNAVQDAVRGDMLSGMSHGMQALLTACLIAGGALMASLLVRMVTGGVLL